MDQSDRRRSSSSSSSSIATVGVVLPAMSRKKP
jgi:hypothetical protein